jgi:predicted TIM-barrel fold metal-dependent hydrolase
LDDPGYNFLWKKIMDMGAIVAFDLGWNDGPNDFMIDRFTAMMKKFPGLRTVLCHLGVSRLWDFSQPAPYPHLQKTLDLLDINKDNLYFDFSGLQCCEPSLEYPYARCLDILKTAVERCGTSRMMWGSDAPMILRYSTYVQTLTCFTKHCDFMSKSDWSNVLFDNAKRIYFS